MTKLMKLEIKLLKLWKKPNQMIELKELKYFKERLLFLPIRRNIQKLLSITKKHCLRIIIQRLKQVEKHYRFKRILPFQKSYEKGLKIDSQNAECKDGLLKVQNKMYSQPETKEEAEERARHAMADPEIQHILRDPQIMILLQNLQENPTSQESMQALRDPKVAEKINKLVAAGIIKIR